MFWLALHRWRLHNLLPNGVGAQRSAPVAIQIHPNRTDALGRGNWTLQCTHNSRSQTKWAIFILYLSNFLRCWRHICCWVETKGSAAIMIGTQLAIYLTQLCSKIRASNQKRSTNKEAAKQIELFGRHYSSSLWMLLCGIFYDSFLYFQAVVLCS